MKKQLNYLEEFNNSFNIEYPKTPLLIDLKTQELRSSLLEEEIKEYELANSSGNTLEVLDAITDMLYIVLGTAVQHGMQNVLEEAFLAVHQSNMSKLDENGKPVINGDKIYDPTRPIGKVLKSSRFTPPTKRLEELILQERKKI